MPVNDTHDPNLKSWVESANDPNTDFPIQNLPWCVFDEDKLDDGPRLGIAIGDQMLDVPSCAETGLLDDGDDWTWLANYLNDRDLEAILRLDGEVWWPLLRKRV